MKVKCKNGLCDRLAMIFSYLQKVRSEGDHLEVVWPVDQECNGHFLDVFQPVCDMTFIDECEVDFYGWEPCEEFCPREMFVYNGLIPKDEITNQVQHLRFEIGEYIAVQVRRTDKLDPIKAPWFVNTEDDQFFDFIDAEIENKVFLASDCRKTQEDFRSRYGDKLVCSSEIEPDSGSLRQTSLEIAAIDLYVCIHARKFFGTKMSGFSRFIEQHRENKRNRLI